MIAMLRSPTRTDGPLARIMWMTAVILESDPSGAGVKEAEMFRRNAAVAQKDLITSGEGGMIPFADEGEDRNHEEDSYDAIVPLFYR